MSVQVSFPIEAICIRALHCLNCLRSNCIAFGRTTAWSDLGHRTGNHSANQAEQADEHQRDEATLHGPTWPCAPCTKDCFRQKNIRKLLGKPIAEDYLQKYRNILSQGREDVPQSDWTLKCQTKLPLELLKGKGGKGCLNRNSACIMKQNGSKWQPGLTCWRSCWWLASSNQQRLTTKREHKWPCTHDPHHPKTCTELPSTPFN